MSTIFYRPELQILELTCPTDPGLVLVRSLTNTAHLFQKSGCTALCGRYTREINEEDTADTLTGVRLCTLCLAYCQRNPRQCDRE